MSILTKIFQGIFGSKTERDIKELQPYVGKINAEFEKLQSLSNDELRKKTQEFKQYIKEKTKSITDEIVKIKDRIDSDSSLSIQDKENLYNEIEKLEKQELELIEEALQEILPQAFAVVKETARRFKENETIEVTASELDKELATRHEHITIEGDKAIYNHTWLAAGNPVTWDMVHYDVQLIGGTVLHQGKIAEMQTGEGKTLVATLH